MSAVPGDETGRHGETEHPPLTEAISVPSASAGPGAMRIAVLGAGSWGTTFAKVLADGGAQNPLALVGR